MRCINKRIVSLLTITFIFSTLTGCGASTIPLSYNSENPNSSFLFSDGEGVTTAETFANDLCVIGKEDIVENTDVDMTRACAAGLFDLNNSNIIYSQNIHERLHPASLTKIMTAIVALKYGNLEDVITVTQNVTITESGAQLSGFKPGDTLTLDQALHALLINSSNDAAMIIAEHIGGSIEGFADMMNQEAVSLGATNSHFVNPHGLTAEDHYVTAYDLYLIFNEAISYNYFVEVIHMTQYDTIYHNAEGEEVPLSFGTTNLYLKGTYNAPESVTVIGGKTGTTNAAASCLILYTKDTAGAPYISVILRAEEREIMYYEMTDLLSEI